MVSGRLKARPRTPRPRTPPCDPFSFKLRGGGEAAEENPRATAVGFTATATARRGARRGRSLLDSVLARREHDTRAGAGEDPGGRAASQ